MQLEGQQFDRYYFVRLLARGGMGQVYLAEDTRIDRQVAIKLLRTDIFPFADANSSAIHEALRLFQLEAKVISTLDHPHILPLFDYGEVSIGGIKCTYMVMPYRREGSLANWLQEYSRSGKLPLRDVTHFLLQAADALQYAHNHQIIHRDVKPSNFLIFNSEKYQGPPDLQLADFGVAKLMSAISTPSHTIRGTPLYMAPEQWIGEAVPATDQYALAIMTYELLVGSPPFRGENQQQILYKHLNVPPKPPSALNPRIPVEIDIVLMRALLKNPADRYSSISAFAQAFQHALVNGRNVRVTVTITPSEARTGIRRLITLPGGRRVSVPIPAGAYDRQVLHLEGMGEQTRYGGPVGALVITISITRAEEAFSLRDSTLLDETVAAFEDDEANRSRPRPRFRGTIFLLLGLALSIILGSVGWMAYSRLINKETGSSGPLSTTSSLAPSDTETAVVQSTNASVTARAGLTATQESAMATAAAQASATAFAVNATATVQTQLTATATVYAGIMNAGTPALNDPLSDNSKRVRWDVTSIPGGGGCAFVNGMYHSTMPQTNAFSPCFAEGTNVSNCTYQVQMTILKGDRGGIAFRGNAAQGTFYYYYVGTDGVFGLDLYNGNTLTTTLVPSRSSPAIKTGSNQTNVIAVVADGNNLKLFVNMQLIASVSDPTLTQGQIGVVAEDINNPTDVVFSNVRVSAL